MKARSLAVLFTVLALLGGCGADQDITKDWSAERLYKEAKEALDDGNWKTAIQYFEKLEARYPYGRYAQQAQLEIAYANYRDGEPGSAIAACDRFLKTHPNHPNADYAHYLKGVVLFEGDLGILTKLGQDRAERDPKTAQESYDAFRELVKRYPASRYAADAAARMRFLVDALAMHEVYVARYYMKRGAYVAATNRAQEVVRSYPRTPANEEALAIMAQAYDRLGLPALRDDAARVLRVNFPRSEFLAQLRFPAKN